MKFRPILFSGEMVQAILAGQKTQTRRLVLPQPKWDPISCHHISKFGCWNYGRPFISPPDFARDNWPFHPGDILWVRETWAEMPYGYVYRADGEKPYCWDAKDRWKPSIHMPKEAARIFLRVKDVRVERLQDITEEQAEKEGCAGWHVEISGGPWGVEDDPDEGTAVDDFQRVWGSTIKLADLDKYGWNANPWVWVIEFERCEKPEGWCS